jgi:hypothetical protein
MKLLRISIAYFPVIQREVLWSIIRSYKPCLNRGGSVSIVCDYTLSDLMIEFRSPAEAK